MKTSVVICTYNGSLYIEEQLCSILEQTVRVDEIIICDDRSTDNTVLLIKSFQNTNPHITLSVNNEQLGSTRNFLKGIKRTSGNIIFLSDQDDYWEPNKVERMLDVFRQNPTIEVIATNGYFYDGKESSDDKVSVWNIPDLLNKEKVDFTYFEVITSLTNFATGASMAFRNNIKNLLMYNGEHKELLHDEYIALLACQRNTFLFLEEKLFHYRIHPDQQVGSEFFKLNHKRINYIAKAFLRKNTFEEYKGALKVISSKHNNTRKIINLTSIDKQTHELLQKSLNTSEEKFQEIYMEMKKRFPVKTMVLNFIDFFTRKRKLL